MTKTAHKSEHAQAHAGPSPSGSIASAASHS